MNTPKLSALIIYPLKSAAGISLTQSPLDSTGLRYDRRWMLIDSNNNFLSQRQFPKMALISPSLDQQGQLSLQAPTLTEIKVPLITHSIGTLPVTIWGAEIEAHHLSLEVDQWLSSFLGVDCRLVTLADETHRQCDLKYAQQGDHTTFTDGFPLLLCTEASLADLNNRLSTQVSMAHFRPNIVISGTQAFEEDLWETITINELNLQVVKPCSRCIITTIDPTSGEKIGAEPLKTLMSYRQKNNKIYFGQNVIPRGSGILTCNSTLTLA